MSGAMKPGEQAEQRLEGDRGDERREHSADERPPGEHHGGRL